MNALLKIVFVLAVLFFLFGGPIVRFIRFLCRRLAQPPSRPSPPPRRRPRRRRVPASEDIVDAEIIEQRDR